MTPEEQKKAEEAQAGQVVDLHNTQTTTTSGRDETTERPIRTISTTSRTLSPDASALNEQQADEFAKQHQIDRSKGEYVGPIGNLLGFDPDRFKKQQEADEKLERFKQKEAGWANALGVIIDAATAIGGGDVNKREPNNAAAKAKEKADKARDNVYALGETIQKAKDAKVREWQAAERQRNADFLNKYMQQQTQQETEYGTTTKHIPGTTTTVDTHTQQQVRTPGGGVKKKKNWVIDIKKGGLITPTTFELEPADYDIVANRLINRYTQIINDRDSKTKKKSDYAKNSMRYLEEKGVLYFDSKGNPKFNKDLIMSHGKFYDLTDEDKAFIVEKTGNRVKFTPNGDIQVTDGGGSQATFGEVTGGNNGGGKNNPATDYWF